MAKKTPEYTGPQVFVAGNTRYDMPVHVYGKLEFQTDKFLKDPSKYRLVVLTGGEDINPAIYGEPAHPLCGFSNEYRDSRDVLIASIAIRWKIPIVGICRGAQLLCALAGGTLVQHCDNHGLWHYITDAAGTTLYVSSTHHQMMLPPSTANVLAWAVPRLSTEYYNGYGKIAPPNVEADVVHFPTINALGFQYHPEYMSDADPSVDYFYQQVWDVLNLSYAHTKGWDDFVSLPKDPITREKIDAEEKLFASLTKAEKEKYGRRQYRENFLAQEKREYMALLWSPEEAEKKAKAAWENFLETMRRANQGAHANA